MPGRQSRCLRVSVARLGPALYFQTDNGDFIMSRKPPVRRPGETDEAFYKRVLSYEVYQDRERERNKRRERKDYHRKWLRDHYTPKPKSESARKRRELALKNKMADRLKRAKEREAIELALLSEASRRHSANQRVRHKARMNSDQAYAESYRIHARDKAARDYARKKEADDYAYHEKLLRSKCYASAKRLENPPDAEYYSGESGRKRFYRDIERAFMYGVFRLNSELEAAEAERERSGRHSLAEREYLERRGAYRMSSSERIIFDLLTDAGIAFEREKKFDWLLSSMTGRAYRVDFYIPLLSTVIEYNGPQHYVNRFGKDMKELIHRQVSDLDKYDQLSAHGIQVIVIPCEARDANAIRAILEHEGVIHGRIDCK